MSGLVSPRRVKLGGHEQLNAPLRQRLQIKHDPPDIFALVVLGDGQIATARLQIVHLDRAVGVVLHGESRVNHARDVVVPKNKTASSDCHQFKKRRHTTLGRSEVSDTLPPNLKKK